MTAETNQEQYGRKSVRNLIGGVTIIGFVVSVVVYVVKLVEVFSNPLVDTPLLYAAMLSTFVFAILPKVHRAYHIARVNGVKDGFADNRNEGLSAIGFVSGLCGIVGAVFGGFLLAAPFTMITLICVIGASLATVADDGIKAQTQGD